MSSENQSLADHLLAAAQEDDSWIVQVDDDTQRRLTTDEVVDAYNQRMIDPETYVWKDGMQAWEQLQAVDPLVDALHARASEPPPEARKGETIKETHEDSAIFSLAMLTSDNQTTEPSIRGDDSGLIDLRAIAAAAEPASEPLQVPMQTLDLMQPGLFHAPPASVPAPVPPPAKSSRGVVLGLVAAVAVLSALLIFVVVRSQPQAQPAASTAPPTASTPQVDPPAPREVAGAPTPVASEKPAPAASEEPAEEKKVATNQPPRPNTPAPPRKANPKTQPKTVPKTPTKTPGTGGCQCAPKDLDCHMRCAVK